MEFLKALLGDELYTEVKKVIDAHNGDEANKDAQVKLANLATGEYVGKGKHDALQADLDSKLKELESANALIAELKKAGKSDESLQGKIAEYESQVTNLQAELVKTKLASAIKLALLEEKAVDIDYLTFKLNENLADKGESLELDENDKIKGWDDKLTGLKTQYPTMFEAAGGEKKIIEKKLPGDDGGGDPGLTRETILKKSYAERMQLYNDNPEAYNAAMGH